MIAQILTLLGSLGMFLYGMKVMSESLQRLAGDRLRAIMHAMTVNRFSGLTTGFLVTCLVQSSSASTVMIVSFANAGLLTLAGAISMIFGANLGTTTTFWLVSILGFKFSISSIALPLMGIALPLLFARKSKLKNTGEFLIGFGLLFLGLMFLKETVPDLQDPKNSETLKFIQNFTNHGVVSVFWFILFGTLLTITVQSSSVAGAITLTMASKGWIDYPSACAIILGENIGTTITANLAAIGGNVSAKRAARAHFLFNMIGVLWAVILFVPLTQLGVWISRLDPTDVNELPMLMAVFHTGFNFINICLLIGFIPMLQRMVERLVVDKSIPGAVLTGRHMNYESALLPQTGELNIAEAERDVERMGALTRELLNHFSDVFENGSPDLPGRVMEAKRLEQESDVLSFETTAYLLRCSSSGLSQSTLGRITALLRVVAELEEICDCGYRLVMMAERKHRKGRILPPETMEQVREFSNIIFQFMDFYTSRLRGPVAGTDLETAYQLEKFIDSFRKKLRRDSMNRMQLSGEAVKSEMLYIDILNNMESIGNHAINVMQALRHAE